MKKIVALVLSLVMVLGLATTAFAATPAYLADVTDLSKACTVTSTYTNHTFELEEQVPEIGVTRTFAKYVLWAIDKDTKAPTAVEYFTVAASAESAAYAFVDGANITYLQKYSVISQWEKNIVVALVPTVDEDDVEKCGDMFTKGDYAVYADAAANLYVEISTGTIEGYVDGKLVKLNKVAIPNMIAADKLALYDRTQFANGSLIIVKHAYDYDAVTVQGDETVTKVFCTECDAEFDFVYGVEDKAIAKFGAGNYYNNVVHGLHAKLYVAKTAGAAAPVAPEATDKVESAETFDAGIAMYVGMSVMAAAGSAVVLKKKD